MEYLKSNIQKIGFYPKIIDSLAKGRKTGDGEKLLELYGDLSKESSGLDYQVVMGREG